MAGEAENSPAADPPLDSASPWQSAFWRPGARRIFSNFGSRWLFELFVLLPGLGGGAVMYSYRHSFWTYVFAIAVCLAVSLPIAWSYASQAALREMPDLFCIYCGRDLTGLADQGNCPQCRRPYSRPQIEAYRRDPAGFIARLPRTSES